MPSNSYHTYQQHRLSKRRVSLQHHHDLLFDKCSTLQEFLIFEVDPSIRLKLQRDLRVTQEELEQVQSQLQQVLEELDRLTPLPDPPPSPRSSPPSPRPSPPSPRPSPPPPFPLPIISIKPWVFILSMVTVWLIVGLWSSSNLENARQEEKFFGLLPERDIVPGLPGAFGGLISGFLSALIWIKSTRYRDQAQVVLMGMGVGMVSGALVWATLWAFVRESLDHSTSHSLIYGSIFGSIFGLALSITVLLWFDLKRTKL